MVAFDKRETAAAIERVLMAERDGSRCGTEIAFRCPFHDDHTPSASWNTQKECFNCRACGAKGGRKKLAAKLGIEVRQRSHARTRGKPKPEIVKTYEYVNAAGDLVSRTCRTNPKGFFQQRPDGRGGWINGLDGVEPVLDNLVELLNADRHEFVFIAEGEKDVDRLRIEKLCAVCNPMGAGNWRDDYSASLRDRHVVVVPDNDEAGEKHAQSIVRSVFPVAASVRILRLPGLPEKGDLSDWLDRGHNAAELVTLARAVPPLRRATLAEVKEAFARHLHCGNDAGLIVAILGAVAASRLPGDPVWLLVVGPPGSGKTEHIMSVSKLPWAYLAATLTEPALLSGTSKRERSADSKGGLLRQIGAQGLLILKDFTSVLAMPRDPRGQVLAALREVYDGSWMRRVGADGGTELEWKGKLGIIAGVTEAIDTHHAVVGALGERFVLYRMSSADNQVLAERALLNAGHEEAMRDELADHVTRLFASLSLSTRPTLSRSQQMALARLADLSAWCRSAIIRDGYRQEIALVPEREAPGRLAKELAGFYVGMLAIGAEHEEAWRLVAKVALDCLPKLRLASLRLLAAEANWITTTEVAERLANPTATVRRTLEDMAAHRIVERKAGGDGKADLWRLSDRARDLYAAVGTFPEMSGTGCATSTACDPHSSNYPNTPSTDFSGKVGRTTQSEGRVGAGPGEGGGPFEMKSLEVGDDDEGH